MMIIGNQYARRSTVVPPPMHHSQSRAADISGNTTHGYSTCGNAAPPNDGSVSESGQNGRQSVVAGPAVVRGRKVGANLTSVDRGSFRVARRHVRAASDEKEDRFSAPATRPWTSTATSPHRATVGDANDPKNRELLRSERFAENEVGSTTSLGIRHSMSTGCARLNSVVEGRGSVDGKSWEFSTTKSGGESDFSPDYAQVALSSRSPRHEPLQECVNGELQLCISVGDLADDEQTVAETCEMEQCAQTGEAGMDDPCEEASSLAEGAAESGVKRSRVPVGLKLFLLFLLYYGILSAYTLLGGLLMRAVEQPYEQETRALSDQHNSLFLDFVRNKTAAYWNDSDFQQFTDELADYLDVYTHRIRCGYVSSDERWSLINSMFYVGTLFTTIGYGQIAPVTRAGRIMTVIISLIGIPLLMLNVAHLGSSITYIIQTTVRCLRRKLNLAASKDAEATGQQEYNIPLSIAFLIILIYILAMAGVVSAAEEWPFVDSVYFTFTTLATIGLGDLVPDHPLLLLVFSIFIIVGLTLVAVFIEIFCVQLEKRLVRIRRFAHKVLQGRRDLRAVT